MNFNQSNEQLKQNIAHLKIIVRICSSIWLATQNQKFWKMQFNNVGLLKFIQYEKEKAELEAMEAQSRALEQEVERKSARNNQRKLHPNVIRFKSICFGISIKSLRCHTFLVTWNWSVNSSIACLKFKTNLFFTVRCGIYDKLSNFMDTTAATCAMGKIISKASKDIEKELEKVDACDAEMVQVQNELKAELQRTIDDFVSLNKKFQLYIWKWDNIWFDNIAVSQDEDKVQDRIEALQIQKHELEAKLERRRIVFTDLVERNRLKKEVMERIRQQNLEKTLELQSVSIFWFLFCSD